MKLLLNETANMYVETYYVQSIVVAHQNENRTLGSCTQKKKITFSK